MTAKSLSDFGAYTVVSFWIDLGCAYVHGDGAGINVLLQATPIDGRIVLRPFVNEGRKDAAPRDGTG